MFAAWSQTSLRPLVHNGRKTRLAHGGRVFRADDCVNLPNSITMSRIFSVPLLIWMLSPHFPHGAWHGESEVVASLFFILVSISDGVDGYLARRWKVEGMFGRMVDPFVDKVLVLGTFIFFAGKNFVARDGGGARSGHAFESNEIGRQHERGNRGEG